MTRRLIDPLAIDVRQSDKVPRALAITASVRSEARVVFAPPVLLRCLVAAVADHVFHFALGELGHGNGLNSVRELPVDAAAGSADESVEVQADVLGHHLVAVEAALVGWAGALEVA